MNSMFLFGAGASIDAGLADAFNLTKKIYDRLCDSRDQDSAKIFGIITARVLARKVRDGGSPFEKVNVEEVYDGLRRLAGKDSDFLSDFVTGWDPAISLLRTSVQEKEADDAFQSLIDSLHEDTWTGRGRLKIQSGGTRKIVELLENFRRSSTDLSGVQSSLLRALVESLKHETGKIEYFESILRIVKEQGGDITTLNYDLIAEDAANRSSYTYDYGLEKWNKEKVVEFKRSSQKNIRIIKLHGSINWFAQGDDIDVRDKNETTRILPNLVFGGASEKLRIDGPFLQLRHEFQTRLLSCNQLVIIGYSFQDEHLNSIIRRWTNTRRKAKLIIVDPAETGRFAGLIGRPYLSSDSQKRELTVDLNHIKMGAAAAVSALSTLVSSPIELKREDRNGFLPHIHFNVVN